jgi:hypothetical protein
VGKQTGNSATYQIAVTRTAFFFGNSGSDLRVRNEIYFVTGNGPNYAAPTANFSDAPAPFTTTNIENDKDSVKLDIAMKLTANAHATGDQLLVKLPKGT